MNNFYFNYFCLFLFVTDIWCFHEYVIMITGILGFPPDTRLDLSVVYVLYNVHSKFNV